jgi:hypothetical protein
MPPSASALRLAFGQRRLAFGQGRLGFALASRHDRVANAALKPEQESEQAFGIAHVPARSCASRWWVVDTAWSSAAFSSGDVSLMKLPPPTSGPARYFSRLGLRSGG